MHRATKVDTHRRRMFRRSADVRASPGTALGVADLLQSNAQSVLVAGGSGRQCDLVETLGRQSDDGQRREAEDHQGVQDTLLVASLRMRGETVRCQATDPVARKIRWARG